VRRNEYFSEVAVRNGPVIFIFKCPITPNVGKVNDQFGIELMRHGDFVKDVCFEVDDLDGMLKGVKSHGNEVLQPRKLISDMDGSLITATIRGSAGNIVHTLIQNIDYEGILLPGFKAVDNHRLCDSLDPISFHCIDHVVEGHPMDALESVTDWYHRTLNMTRFWSIDERICQTEFSSLKASFVSNTLNTAKVVLVEPAEGRRKGQVQEFLDFNGGPGIQHIAFRVSNILTVVHNMRERGVDFLDIPDSYYTLLEERISNSSINIKEDLVKIRKLKILLDFDEGGYLLQIFTKPCQDRPTLFLEVIQRDNYEGFGAGNFKALFAAVEMEQRKREENGVMLENRRTNISGEQVR